MQPVIFLLAQSLAGARPSAVLAVSLASINALILISRIGILGRRLWRSRSLARKAQQILKFPEGEWQFRRMPQQGPEVLGAVRFLSWVDLDAYFFDPKTGRLVDDCLRFLEGRFGQEKEFRA